MNTEQLKFAGFGDWVEIFTGGRQKDSSGNVHDGDALIEKAVETFDAAYHEPPAVIGHPRDNTPAFGWVSALKAETRKGAKRLYAKFKQVVPEFEEAVKSGRFKKRSAAFYPDGRLRHVGWLGAMPPAVKGLSDVAFSADDQAIDFEFEETKPKPKKENRKMKFAEFVEALKFWNKIQEDPDADFPVFKSNEPPVGLPPEKGKTFSEADIAAAKKEAADAAKEAGKKEAMAEFAEAESKRKQAAAKAKIQVFIDGGIKSGKIAPAWKDGGLSEFMESLDVEQTIEFGEGEGKQKKTGLDWFTDFLEGLPKLVDFAEVATRDKEVKGGNAGAKIETLVKKKLAADKDLAYTAAFSEVMDEHPDLATEYRQELDG